MNSTLNLELSCKILNVSILVQFIEFVLTHTVRNLLFFVHLINVWNVMMGIKIVAVFSLKNLLGKFRKKLLGLSVSFMIGWDKSKLTSLIGFRKLEENISMHFLSKN